MNIRLQPSNANLLHGSHGTGLQTKEGKPTYQFEFQPTKRQALKQARKVWFQALGKHGNLVPFFLAWARPCAWNGQEAEQKVMRSALITLSLLLGSFSAGFAGEEVTDKKFGFSLKVPDPFFRQENDPAQPDIIHTFLDRKATPEDPATVIIVQRLHGLVDPHSHIKASEFPEAPGTSATVQTIDWHGLSLDLMRVRIENPDSPTMISYVLQLPLQGEAVQMGVGGPEEREADNKKTLAAVAAEFKNLKPLFVAGRLPQEKEPLPTPERAALMAKGIFKLLISALILALILRVVFRLFRGKKPAGNTSNPPPLPPPPPNWSGLLALMAPLSERFLKSSHPRSPPMNDLHGEASIRPGIADLAKSAWSTCL